MSIVDELFERNENAMNDDVYDDEVADWAELAEPDLSFDVEFTDYDEDFEVEDDEWC